MKMMSSTTTHQPTAGQTLSDGRGHRHWILFGIAVLLLLAVGFESRQSIRDLIANDQRMMQSHRVIAQLEDIYSDAADAHAVGKNYLLSGNDRWRAQYQEETNAIEAKLTELHALAEDGSSPKPEIATLDRLLKTWLGALSESVEERQRDPQNAARQTALLESGATLMDAVRELTAQIETAERDLLKQHTERTDASASRAAWLISGGTVLALALLGFTFVTIHRQFQERLRVGEELARARDAALETARLKSEFLANMSHEIRTPMNGVVGMTGLLLDSPLNADQRQFAETIRTSADSLLTIINDILDFSKIEAGKMEMEMLDFDLRDSVESTLDLLAERAQGKGLELSGLVTRGVPVHLRGDPGRLRQVLTNLLGNAIKFTHQGEVVLRVQTVEEDAARAVLRFEIRDTGAGIPLEAQPRLFQAFSQADGSTTRKYGGTGLGLAISQRLVTLMGGSIGFQSKPGIGSTFWFTAAFDKLSEPITQENESIPDVESLRVLIVDDNDTNREILEHQVIGWKMRPSCAVDGREALRMLCHARERGEPFQFLILDLQMPDMDGLQLAERIQQDPDIAGIPTILLTSLGVRLDAQDMKRLGIGECQVKPVKASRLLEGILRVVGGTPARRWRAEAGPRREGTLATPGFESVGAARILLVEDNHINQKVAMGQLKKLGLHADAVGNGREALGAVQNVPYDIVLMDCQMPEMDGYEATRQIRTLQAIGRSERAARRCPHIIAMTANAMKGDRDKCIAAGMDDYVCKPVQVAELHAALMRWRCLQEQGEASGGSVEDTRVPENPGTAGEPHLDEQRLLEVANGDPAEARNYLELYQEQLTEVFAALQKAFEAEDLSSVRSLAHKLSGASSTCGMTRLGTVLHRLEADASNENLQLASTTFTEARELVRPLQDEMGRFLASLQTMKEA